MVAVSNNRLFLPFLLACLPSSCGGFNNSNNIPTHSQPQQQEQQQQVLPGSCVGSNDDDDDVWMSSSARQLFNDETTRQRLVETIQSGRVYQHEDFLTPVQVDMLLKEILNLQDSFARSGLSNTQKGSQQEFGSLDRFVCPVPWWKDSLLLTSSSSAAASSSLHENTAKNNTVAMLLNKLRFFLSDTLDRPSLKDSAALSSPIAHECYYSVSHQGSILARHMDERHEECKGAKGWLLPSRRSLSWLIYLTDENWTLEENGGGLRTYPQKRVQQHHVSSSHEGNLQVGWLVPSSNTEEDHDNDDDKGGSIPVYLDSWFQPHTPKETEPHCILYTVVAPPPRRDTSTKLEQLITDRVFLTHAFLSTALSPGISLMDFIKAWAAKDSNAHVPSSSSLLPPNAGSSDSTGGGGATSASSSTTTTQGFFLKPEFAQQFALLEERQEWDAGQLPRGCQVQDINPTRASFIIFDSLLLPHQVEAVKKGRRIALAGWMHEATQPFPEYYSTF